MRRTRPTEHGWLAYYRELLGTWRRKAQGPGDVEDSAHDAIANMLEGDAIRNPRAYLHRSIHHGLISRHHRQQREAAVPLHDLAEDEHPAHEDPEANVRTAQLSRALMEALAELPQPCAAVFAWHRLEGRSGRGNRGPARPVEQQCGKIPDAHHAALACAAAPVLPMT